MAYFLALASAGLYGAADFLGGLATRRSATLIVVVWSQAAGLITLLAVLPLLPDASPTRSDLFWGGVAGVAGSCGVALLYRALAIGRMAVVAPTTAVCAVIIPVLAGFLAGERVARLTAGGIGLAIAAIVLVSQESRGANAAPGPTGIGVAFLSGSAIGFFFLALARTGSTAGMWPLAVSRATSLVLFGGALFVARGTFRLAGPVARTAVSCGVLDMAANACYLAATRYGALSIVVTLASLYPASTVILARVVLGERLNGRQVAGVACALVAIVLIVRGG
jgi:drug/metabolite transporter (DMT)-like permease